MLGSLVIDLHLMRDLLDHADSPGMPDSLSGLNSTICAGKPRVSDQVRRRSYTPILRHRSTRRTCDCNANQAQCPLQELKQFLDRGAKRRLCEGSIPSRCALARGRHPPHSASRKRPSKPTKKRSNLARPLGPSANLPSLPRGGSARRQPMAGVR